jgi:hypothetical protein
MLVCGYVTQKQPSWPICSPTGDTIMSKYLRVLRGLRFHDNFITMLGQPITFRGVSWFLWILLRVYIMTDTMCALKSVTSRLFPSRSPHTLLFCLSTLPATHKGCSSSLTKVIFDLLFVHKTGLSYKNSSPYIRCIMRAILRFIFITEYLYLCEFAFKLCVFGAWV